MSETTVVDYEHRQIGDLIVVQVERPLQTPPEWTNLSNGTHIPVAWTSLTQAADSKVTAYRIFTSFEEPDIRAVWGEDVASRVFRGVNQVTPERCGTSTAPTITLTEGSNVLHFYGSKNGG